MADPNPQVAGKGLQMLADAGIPSAVNLLNEQAEALNKGFLKTYANRQALCAAEISHEFRWSNSHGER